MLLPYKIPTLNAVIISIRHVDKIQFPFVELVGIQGGSNMTGTDLYVNKPHCAAAVRP